MSNTNQPKLSKKENIIQVVKFGLISASAGIIEFAVFSLMSLLFKDGDYGPSYFIALAASVLWNFTINRKFTFKSANNIPVAMLLVFGYYLMFTPLSVWWGTALTQGQSTLVEYLVLSGTMLVNLVTEYLFQRFVVFRKHKPGGFLDRLERRFRKIASKRAEKEWANDDEDSGEDEDYAEFE